MFCESQVSADISLQLKSFVLFHLSGVKLNSEELRLFATNLMWVHWALMNQPRLKDLLFFTHPHRFVRIPPDPVLRKHRFQSTTIGVTTIGQIESAFRDATRVDLGRGEVLYTIPSNDPKRPNTIKTTDGFVSHLRTVLGQNQRLTLSELVSLFGEPEDKTERSFYYGPNYRWHIWSNIARSTQAAVVNGAGRVVETFSCRPTFVANVFKVFFGEDMVDFQNTRKDSLF